MASDELGGGIDGDVRSVVERAEEHGRDGVVHHQGYPVFMGDGGYGLEIRHVELGVADALQVEGPGAGTDSGAEVLRIAGVDEADGDAELGERVAEEIVGPSVEAGGADDLVP